MNRTKRLKNRSTKFSASKQRFQLLRVVKSMLDSPRLFFFLKLLIGSILCFILYLFVTFISVKEITCTSQYGRCSEEIMNSFEPILETKTIYARKLVSNTLSHNHSIEKYSVRIYSPNRIHVDVIEKSAEFALENKDYNTFAILDEQGVVMELVENSVLPAVVTDAQLPSVGESVSEEVLFGINLARKLRPEYELSTFTFKDRHLEVKDIDGFTVYFPLEGDQEVLLGSLTLILSRLKQSQEEFRIEDNRNISEIDLRFKNPVLR